MDLRDVCLIVAKLSDHPLYLFTLWVIVCECERRAKEHDLRIRPSNTTHLRDRNEVAIFALADLPLPDVRTAFRFDLAEKTSPMVGPCRTRNDRLLRGYH